MLKLKEYLTKEGWKKDWENSWPKFTSITCTIIFGIIGFSVYMANEDAIHTKYKIEVERSSEILERAGEKVHKNLLEKVIALADRDKSGVLTSEEQVEILKAIGRLPEDYVFVEGDDTLSVKNLFIYDLKKALEHYQK